MDNVTILVAGVAVIDMVFSVDALPQRPEKYRAKAATMIGGGCAANAAVAIARLGGSPVLVSRVGADSFGTMIVDDLEREGVNCDHIQRHEGCQSTISSVYVTPDGERQLVSFRDWSMPDIPSDLGAVTEFSAYLADTRWPIAATTLMQMARSQGVAGIIDAEAPLAGCEEAMALASHIAFSMQGLRDYTGLDDAETGLRKAAETLDAILIVTDGQNGVYWLEEERLQHASAFQVDAVDTLGAGDVWHGAFALCLGQGKDLRAAILYASATAALKCLRFGGRNGAPMRDEVDIFLKEHAS